MAHKALAVFDEIFNIEQHDATLVVTPLLDLRELDYQRIETRAKEILGLLNGTAETPSWTSRRRTTADPRLSASS